MDGLIAADPGVIWLAKKHCPSVPLHLSTQAHSVNGAAVAFWREAGVERINLARELGFKQIRALAEAFPGVDFEVFVHGAMCLALSGHCLLSAWVNNRPANQGRCTQPCRFEYRGLSLLVEEQKRSAKPCGRSARAKRSAVFGPRRTCACCGTWDAWLTWGYGR